MHEVVISGVGYHAPDKILTNAELEKIIETSDEWIRERTGIRERRVAPPEHAMSDMSIPAARQALEHAQVDPMELDLVVCATSTPDMLMPNTAAIIAHGIGAARAAAFDIEAACSGFVYGVVVAQQFIATGMYEHVLVVGGDLLSKFLNWEDRGTAVLFGDGAGAAVLSRSETPGLLATTLGADGSGADYITIPVGSRTPPSGEKGLHCVHMKGREVYKWAVDIVPRTILEITERAGLRPQDVEHYILHQANLRIIDSVAKRVGVREDQLIVNVDRMANTSAGTVPIALAEAAEMGKLKTGDRICMVGFGSGLTWASAIVRWTCVNPFPARQAAAMAEAN
ncbi:MAG: ketoacyl-ACP synthase III [Candidatus Sericytochromatia bacterium]|nr:ketoacyl-ACP synthase III [Candidatus Tanganyikabacteria bacterium]